MHFRYLTWYFSLRGFQVSPLSSSTQYSTVSCSPLVSHSLMCLHTKREMLVMIRSKNVVPCALATKEGEWGGEG